MCGHGAGMQNLAAKKLASSRVKVGNSPINGHGLFAATRLPGRRKLGEISGKLVALPKAWKTVARRRSICLIELTPRTALDCSKGNCFRCVNHSCRPNCYLRIARGRVEVYTLRRITAGCELTVDYGETPHQGGMTCRCGAKKCKGRV